MSLISHPVVYVLGYVLFMLPTYVLPFLGSNSMFAYGGTSVASGIAIQALIIHLGALMMLILLAWIRGRSVGKSWLVVFPLLASVFDMIPFLSLVPLVPTAMHLAAIIIGVASNKDTVSMVPTK